ncbi:unnamed protein product [Nesidiocoris tenuis]|uniref:Uncharacterized protein n=1 Tax=Nesidiocoris tenuis TaxID=355587 RepID=A0A6H5GUZ0_9HEMI|nr:unnamed protein product [Nesidiocoris tenuis]
MWKPLEFYGDTDRAGVLVRGPGLCECEANATVTEIFLLKHPGKGSILRHTRTKCGRSTTAHGAESIPNLEDRGHGIRNPISEPHIYGSLPIPIIGFWTGSLGCIHQHVGFVPYPQG